MFDVLNFSDKEDKLSKQKNNSYDDEAEQFKDGELEIMLYFYYYLLS